MLVLYKIELFAWEVGSVLFAVGHSEVLAVRMYEIFTNLTVDG